MSYQCQCCPTIHPGSWDAAVKDGWGISVDDSVAICRECRESMMPPQPPPVVTIPLDVLRDGNLLPAIDSAQRAAFSRANAARFDAEFIEAMRDDP